MQAGDVYWSPWTSFRIPPHVEHSMSQPRKKLSRKFYDAELAKLHIRLVQLQRCIQVNQKRVVVLFEGRDAAGKGGTIKRIIAPLNPRICRVVALAKPTERESSQWYFQRYVHHLPAAGEMVLFDRSWYNRAGVEHVMGFCSEREYWDFLRQCPMFERMLIQSGTTLIKYWFSISAEEQERRFRRRIKDPTRRWKISPMDLESRTHWVDYSRAKDQMFLHTDLPDSPWWVVEANDKRRARLNCIHHLLSQISYEIIQPAEVTLPPLQEKQGYIRPDIQSQRIIENQFDDS